MILFFPSLNFYLEYIISRSSFYNLTSLFENILLLAHFFFLLFLKQKYLNIVCGHLDLRNPWPNLVFVVVVAAECGWWIPISFFTLQFWRITSCDLNFTLRTFVRPKLRMHNSVLIQEWMLATARSCKAQPAQDSFDLLWCFLERDGYVNCESPILECRPVAMNCSEGTSFLLSRNQHLTNKIPLPISLLK